MMFEKAKARPKDLAKHVDVIPPEFIKNLTLCQLSSEAINRVHTNYERLKREHPGREIKIKLLCHGVRDNRVLGETKAETIRTQGFLREFNNTGTWGPGVYTDERVRGTVGRYGYCGDTIRFFLCAAFQFNDWDEKYVRNANYTTQLSFAKGY